MRVRRPDTITLEGKQPTPARTTSSDLAQQNTSEDTLQQLKHTGESQPTSRKTTHPSNSVVDNTQINNYNKTSTDTPVHK